MNLKDQFVSYEIAVKLKELGLDEPCLGAFDDEKKVLSGYCKSVPKGFLKAPTYQQVEMWMREEKKVFIKINVHEKEESTDKQYQYIISNLEWGQDKEIRWMAQGEDKDTYEQAREAAIIKALELIN